MSELVQGGRPLARFRLLGFPVTIDISFVLVVGLLGWRPGGEVRDFVLWMVIVPVAVLVHELGHALVARPTGAHPSIALVGLGGLTTYLPPKPLSRGRSVAISLAGPAVGIVLGGAVLLYAVVVGVPAGSTADAVISTVLWTTLGWSVLNLLPVLPLDGGQTLRELLPGPPAVRQVRAAVVSVVVGVAVGVIAYLSGYLFGAIFAALLVVANVLTLRGARQERERDVSQRLVQLLWAGQVDDAAALLAAQPEGPAVHPLVRAAVGAVSGDAERADVFLAATAAEHPDDPGPVGMQLLVRRVRDDWSGALAIVSGPQGAAADPSTVQALQTVAFRAGTHRESAQIGDAWLARAAGSLGDPRRREVAATVAYNSCCGWARAGEPDRAVEALRLAGELGFADLTLLDTDDDLAALRLRADYEQARQVVRRTALDRLAAEDRTGTDTA